MLELSWNVSPPTQGSTCSKGMMKSNSFVTLQGSNIAPARKPSLFRKCHLPAIHFQVLSQFQGGETNMIHWCFGLVLQCLPHDQHKHMKALNCQQIQPVTCPQEKGPCQKESQSFPTIIFSPGYNSFRGNNLNNLSGIEKISFLEVMAMTVPMSFSGNHGPPQT